MSKKLTIRIMAIFLALILCSSISINIFAVETNDPATTTEKSNDIYPNFDLSSYTVDKLPDGLRDSVFPDGSFGKTISPLSADDLYSITIDNGDGTNTLNVFQQPVKYIDENGTVKFRTNALEKVPGTGFLGLFKSEYAYQNEEGDVKTYFSDKIDKGVLLVYNEYEISMIPLTDSTKYPDISGMIGNESIGAGASASSSVSIAKPYDNVAESKASFAQNGNKIEYRNVLTSGITYEYMPLANGIKENIILSEYKGINTFRFIIEMGSLVPETMAVRGDGIRLINPSNSDVMMISPVDAIDAVGRYSLDHAMYLTKTDIPGRYILTVVVDRDFLESKDTVYPVIIDPTIYPDGTTNIADTFVSSNNPNVNYSTQTFMPVGMDVNYAESEAFFQFVGIERYRYITPNNISDAKLVLDCYYTNATSGNPLKLYAYDNLSQNTISSLTWNNKPSTYGSGYGVPNGDPVSITSTGIKQFYITGLVKDWFIAEVNEGGNSYKYSLRIKHHNPIGSTHYATFRATEWMGAHPYFEITYTPSNPFPTGTLVQISNLNSGKDLTVTGTGITGIQQYDYSDQQNHWWKLQYMGNGEYKLETMGPPILYPTYKFLTATTSSSGLAVTTDSTTDMHRFYLLPCYNTDGTIKGGYRIVPKVITLGATGNTAVGIQGGSTSNGAYASCGTYTAQSHQVWEIVRYRITLSSFYDYGFQARYGSSTISEINNRQEKVNKYLMQTFGIKIIPNSPTIRVSYADMCTGASNVNSTNISATCTHNSPSCDGDLPLCDHVLTGSGTCTPSCDSRYHHNNSRKMHSYFVFEAYSSTANINILWTGKVNCSEYGNALTKRFDTGIKAFTTATQYSGSTPEERDYVAYHEIGHALGARGDNICTNNNCVMSYSCSWPTIFAKLTNPDLDLFCTNCNDEIKAHLANNY